MTPPEALAARLVDEQAELPDALDNDSRQALAWALKALCYAAWTSDPQRAARAADALATLAGRPTAEPLATEIHALMEWTGGIAQVTRGRMAEAVGAFDRAAALFRRLGQADAAAQTQVPKIMALSMLGQHTLAAACAERTQKDFIAQGDLLAASKVSLNLGSLHLRHEAYAESARHYREAAVLFSRVGERQHSVMADIGLAGALTSLGDLDEAERVLARARARAAAHDLPVLQAIVDESGALIDQVRGRYGSALAGLERARACYEALAMPQHLAIAEKQLADAYLELRLLPEALALYRPALAKFESLDMPDDRAWTLAQKGRVLALMGQASVAAQAFVTAGRLFREQGIAAGQAAIALARAELALAQHGSAADALEWAGQALEGYRGSGHAEGCARAELAMAHARLQQHQAAQAHAEFDATLAAARADRRVSIQVRALAGRAQAAQALGRHDAAQADFTEAVLLFEDQRRALPGDEIRSAFLADHLLPYRELLRYALQAHQAAPASATAAQALTEHERVRARALGERLALDEADPAGEAGSASEASSSQLRARFNWLLRRAQGLHEDGGSFSPALAQELRSTEQALMERSRRARLGAQRRAGGAPAADEFDLGALREALAEDEVLIEYGVLDDELLAWVVTRQDVVLQRRIARWPDVLDLVRAARFQLETLGHGALPVPAHMPRLVQRCNARLQALHRAAWAPLQALLHGRRRVLLVAPAQLGSLPFPALTDGVHTLADRHELALVPSARIALRGLRQAAIAPRSALLLAESSRLLHARHEVQGVARLFSQVHALVDEEATVAGLQQHAAHADVLHLACHAQFRADNPAFSALHLHDGALTAELAERLRLRPGIVVLSGCETARAGGDEMVGLVRAFLVAGAARVVASLWPVDDAVTMCFMTHFYGAISRDHAPAAAMHLAQKAVMAQHPHPFHWAAFALYGGW